MKSRSLFVLTGMILIALFVPALNAADVAFPYIAQITEDNLNMRSGPGTSYYRCGKLNSANRVKVVSHKFTWSRIVPPSGCFSWISAQYVNPATSTVTGDSVRVYAGSDYVKPEHSTSMQVKLDTGDKVTIIGEKQGDYYKIEPPVGAYLWIKTNYTKVIGPAQPVRPVAEKAAEKPAEKAEEKKARVVIPIEKKAEPVKVEKKEEKKVEAVKEEKPAVEKPKAEEAKAGVVDASLPAESKELKKYYDLKKQIEDEKTKPLLEQNYDQIKKGLAEITENKKSGKASRYAEFSLEQIKRYELAMSVAKEMDKQNKQLDQAKADIKKSLDAALKENPDMGKYTVIGTLKNSNVYSVKLKMKHYRLVDGSGKTICYALPDESAVDIDTKDMIDKKVGLIGKIEPHKQTSGALVRFTKIELIK